MQPITAKQWADALRSGKYEQGKMALCKDGAFCCLGVLAEEAEVSWRYLETPETEIITYREYLFPSRNVADNYNPDAAAIPSMSEHLLVDLDLKRHVSMGRPLQAELMDRNDRGVPFSKIADYIEEQAAIQADLHANS